MLSVAVLQFGVSALRWSSSYELCISVSTKVSCLARKEGCNKWWETGVYLMFMWNTWTSGTETGTQDACPLGGCHNQYMHTCYPSEYWKALWRAGWLYMEKGQTQSMLTLGAFFILEAGTHGFKFSQVEKGTEPNSQISWGSALTPEQSHESTGIIPSFSGAAFYAKPVAFPFWKSQPKRHAWGVLWACVTGPKGNEHENTKPEEWHWAGDSVELPSPD